MIEQGYTRYYFDQKLYFNRLDNRSYIILLFYLDGILVVGTNM